jgi:beta-glucanase (GH16 family)
VSHLRAVRWPYLGLAALLVALVLAAGVTLVASAAPVAPSWSDDFDGPAGSAVDPPKWAHDTGGSGLGNNELEYYTGDYYTGDTSNAALDGQGHLVITARRENQAGFSCWYGQCQYTSARLSTSGRFSQRYGRVEARIQLPRGQGLWPAFWMLGDNIGSVGWPNSGEVDIIENVGSEPNVNHGSLHGPGYSGGNPLAGTYDLGRPLADDFHTYTVDWAPDAITFLVDGHEYERRTPADAGSHAWVFNQPFFLMLNVAAGVNWPGAPGPETAFPQQMIVDYVHVYGAPGSPPEATQVGTTLPGPERSLTPAAPSPGQRSSATTVGTGVITGYRGACVDVREARTHNGTRVQLYTCNATAAQQWTRSGNTMRALGKCLDVFGAHTDDGTRVQLWECNGTVAQDWTYTRGQLINSHSGKCLDARGPSSRNGTPLQIWSCHGGPNQQWQPDVSSPTPASPSGPAPPAPPTPRSNPPTSPAGAKAAAPYLYVGWGNPPDPRTVMSATGVRWFTMAFMLDGGGCNPRWDGSRSLTGGSDQSTIDAIRAGGDDVVISFGGASGPWLEQTCTTAAALAGAYRTVIDSYHLAAIDIDIEGGVYGDPASQQRTIDALKDLKTSRPGVAVYVTFPSDRSGPDSSMIGRAASSGLTVDGWTIMPFDFGAAGQNMGALTHPGRRRTQEHDPPGVRVHRRRGVPARRHLVHEWDHRRRRDRHPDGSQRGAGVRSTTPPGPADVPVHQSGPALRRRIPQR